LFSWNFSLPLLVPFLFYCRSDGTVLAIALVLTLVYIGWPIAGILLVAAVYSTNINPLIS